MTTRWHINRLLSVTLYAVVLYYLLPFSPLALYDASLQHQAASLYHLKKEKAGKGDDFTGGNYYVHKRNHVFPQKDNVRFFIDKDVIPEQQREEIALLPEKKEFSYFHESCVNPLFLSSCGRGPPASPYLSCCNRC